VVPIFYLEYLKISTGIFFITVWIVAFSFRQTIEFLPLYLGEQMKGILRDWGKIPFNTGGDKNFTLHKFIGISILDWSFDFMRRN